MTGPDEEKDDKPSIYTYKHFISFYENSIQKVKKDESAFYVHGKVVKYSKLSLGMLNNKNKLRWVLVWIITSKQFENFIMLLIIINSLVLGMKDYTQKDDQEIKQINKIVQ